MIQIDSHSKAMVITSLHFYFFFDVFGLDRQSLCLESERSEPSSRTFLIGEQPNPWDLLQPQDKMSRHRGAEPGRRYGLLDQTSLLSPG